MLFVNFELELNPEQHQEQKLDERKKSSPPNLVPSIFSNVPKVNLHRPLEVQFLNDDFPMKVDLMDISSRETVGSLWKIPIVDFARKIICNDEILNKEYLSPLGLQSFRTAVVTMLLGHDHEAIIERRCFAVQTLSRTGALRLVAEYLLTFDNCKEAYISAYGDYRHEEIFQQAGFKTLPKYRHWNHVVKKFDFKCFVEDLKDAPQGSAILFHACGYDGCDPSKQDWGMVAKFLKRKGMVPIFDIGCQGFATGDMNEDVWSVRLFISYGFELFCIKNAGRTFGLYNTCIGSLTVVSDNALKVIPMKYKFVQLIGAMYHSPPAHGALVISYILNNHDAYTEWIGNFMMFSKTVNQMRELLRSTLECMCTPGDWSFFTDQKGYFTYTSFSKNQIKYLREVHHVYMVPSGKLSMMGVTPLNVEYIAFAMKDTVINVL
ncbi:unnamed protein product [Brassicogethes aeneus]|uniref:aspartate transaminase n=1 Tax=Brassicogethes aeneus TaxID=1431903 RepID=A0A9P0AU09_BRAAE|nr:unnamed protein product [Brassicogethes aeneus]